MKNFFVFYILALALLSSGCKEQKDQFRERLSFNEGWVFDKGHHPEASETSFDDSDWRKLSLPHDWAIEGPFNDSLDARTGGLPIYGEAWYRKDFEVKASDKGKVITLDFDGVMSNGVVYLNGKKAGYRPYGYSGFQVDLTPYINFGETNTLAVKVHPEELSARWYPGAGIYRNVWLEVKSPVHTAHWGTYIRTPEVNKEKAVVEIETKVNNYEGAVEATVVTAILDKDKNVVAESSQDLSLTQKSHTINQSITVKKPSLWDTNTPYLYTAQTLIKVDGSIVDNYETDFGIREIKFTKEGFFINGRKERFKGVCLHHDLGPLGAAVNYRATQRQLEIMKSMGVNAIRTSHNPPSPEQLELCDKMGLLVQVEAFDCWAIGKTENDYHKFWDKWHERDLRDMIKRDRNHPSVIMWSIGNEIKEQRKKNGGEVAKHLTDICHDEDPTRLVTAGFNNYPQCIKHGLADAIDLVGFNYKPTQYDNVLAKHPDMIVYGSETSSCVSSRGEYHLPVENYDKHESLQVSSYDIISPPWAYPPDFEFHAQETMTRSLGEFIWTGFDYLGEPTPYNGKDNMTHGKWGGDWPSRSSYFGAVDLCGMPKDRYYFYQSQWTEEPMVHILPHWNWEGSGQKNVPVYCYTNGDEAELFLNGQSLGRKKMGIDKTTIPADFIWWKRPENTWESPYRLNWDVPYKTGELKVVSYKEGKVHAEKIIRTASKAAKIELVPDRKEITADGSDLSFITVNIMDKDGNLCPRAENMVNFTIEGAGIVAAVGNGNAATTEPFQANYRKAFNGKCMLIVKSKKGMAGEIKVKAESEGLTTENITLQSI